VRRSLDQADGARRALWLAGSHDRRQEAMIRSGVWVFPG
jgi:hypothetical protein